MSITITITITSEVHVVVAVPGTETVSEFGVDEPSEMLQSPRWRESGGSERVRD